MTGSDATGTIIAAIAADKTAGAGETGTTKAQFRHGTTAEDTGTEAEVAIRSVKGDTDATMPRAAGVATRITNGGAGPETETVTGTAASLRTAGGASARIDDKIKK